MAILFNEIQNKIAKKFYQTAILLPYLISIVVVAYLVYAFLATDTGLVNNAIVKGLLGKKEGVAWYMEIEILAVYPDLCTAVETDWIRNAFVSGKYSGNRQNLL